MNIERILMDMHAKDNWSSIFTKTLEDPDSRERVVHIRIEDIGLMNSDDCF